MNHRLPVLYTTILILTGLFVSQPLAAQQQKKISGSVINALTKKPVFGVNVKVYAADGTLLSERGTAHSRRNGIQYSVYSASVPDGTFHLRFEHPDYEIFEDTITVKFHKRESLIQLEPVQLKRKKKDIKLNEVAVKATMVKFYTKKDTLVFNADAFQLAEGSMLDALIRQLPGVELKDDGRILVNGKYVSSLLLNGDDFFRSDRSIMLENLPSYMVKDIKVYEREPDERLRNIHASSGRKETVMDVNLKRQYSIGWIANTEWGAGSEDRYLGKLFALRFSPNSRLSIVGSLNNLNDNRKPGETSSWTPEAMPSGKEATKMAALDYDIKEKHLAYRIKGTAQIEHNDMDNRSQTNHVNFIQGGDTYERSLYQSRNRETTFQTSHTFQQKTFKETYIYITPTLYYRNYTNRSGSINGTFSEDPSLYVSSGLIDSLSGPLAGSLIKDYLINRSLQQNFNEGHQLNLGGKISHILKIPHTEDLFSLQIKGEYNNRKDRTYSHRQWDYPQTTRPTDFQNTFLNLPENSYSYKIEAYYKYDPLKKWTLTPQYTFNKRYASNRRALYRLEKLDGWGPDTEHSLGQLPSVDEWERHTMDTPNSYQSNQHEDTHTLTLDWYWEQYKDGKKWELFAALPLNYAIRRMTYHSNGRKYTPTRRKFLPCADVHISYATHEWKYQYELLYNFSSDMPSLHNLLDIKDDSNPLFITYGNPHLRNSYTHNVAGKFYWRNKNRTEQMFNAGVSYNTTQNAVAMGYTYDRETGIRTSRPENVNGNYQIGGTAGYTTPLDKDKRWTLRSNTNTQYNHSVDLMDAGGGFNPRSVVRSFFATEDLQVDYQMKPFKLGARIKGTWGHATSRRADFEKINTGDLTYGLTGQAELLWNIKLSTDLNLYSRHGYNDPDMNTSDFVWNARLSKTLKGGSLVFILDGFDILGNLSNVTQTLNAQGKVETYRNVIPRYVMLHCIYRLNIKPKKKPGEA